MSRSRALGPAHPCSGNADPVFPLCVSGAAKTPLGSKIRVALGATSPWCLQRHTLGLLQLDSVPTLAAPCWNHSLGSQEQGWELQGLGDIWGLWDVLGAARIWLGIAQNQHLPTMTGLGMHPPIPGTDCGVSRMHPPNSKGPVWDAWNAAPQFQVPAAEDLCSSSQRILSINPTYSCDFHLFLGSSFLREAHRLGRDEFQRLGPEPCSSRAVSPDYPGEPGCLEQGCCWHSFSRDLSLAGAALPELPGLPGKSGSFNTKFQRCGGEMRKGKAPVICGRSGYFGMSQFPHHQPWRGALSQEPPGDESLRNGQCPAQLILTLIPWEGPSLPRCPH